MTHALSLTTAAAFALAALAGCSAQQKEPASPEVAPSGRPLQAPPPEAECKSDADCTGGTVCVESLRAACETCDGGTMVHVCRAPGSR